MGRAGIVLVVTLMAFGVGLTVGPSAALAYPSYDHARVLGNVEHARNRVALTFDDCGDPAAWRSILATLHARGLQATFFCIGQSVQAHPTLGAAAIASQLRRTRSVDARAGSRCRYFRPPYGSYTRTVLQIAGGLGFQRAALWNVDPRDWERPGVAVIQRRVLSATGSGSIVIMHCLPQTAQALPGIIRGLRGRNPMPVLLSTLARIGDPGPGWWPRYSSL